MPLHVFELTMQQAAEQGQWPEASPGNGRRRNRNWTKRKKALAAAAARRATRDPALCLLASRCLQGGDVAKGSALSHVEKEIGVASSPTRSSVVAESPSPGKGKRLATGLQNRTRASFRQHRYLLAAIIDRHSWCSDAVAILPCGVVDDECEILVKSTSLLSAESFPEFAITTVTTATEGRGEGVLIRCCHLAFYYPFLSSRSAVPNPNRDISNIWVLITLFPYSILVITFCLFQFSLLFGRLWSPSIS